MDVKGFRWGACWLALMTLFFCVATQVDASSVGAGSQVVLSVTGDEIPPTVPANTAASAVSSSRIDVSWDASSDNVAVAGYKVFRDGAFIATTGAATLTYSDTGLATNTAYAYTISAFDAALNESARSATATATTLPASGGGGGGVPQIPPTITSLSDTVEMETATTTWATSQDVVSVYSWGTSTDYALGSISETAYDFSHEVVLSGLLPNTTYYYYITFSNRFGVAGTPYAGSFTTQAAPDTTPPANVSELQAATTSAPSIILSWQNPTDSDFDIVRIMRSDIFYPTDPLDGLVVYEGGGEVFEDTAITEETRYYYTVFSKDTAGNYASGAIIDTLVHTPTTTEETPPATSTPPVDEPPPDGTQPPAGDGGGDGGTGGGGAAGSGGGVGRSIFTGTSPSSPPVAATATHPTTTADMRPDRNDRSWSEFERLSIQDFAVIQGGVRKTFSKNGEVSINALEPFTLSVSYEVMPEVLKTLTATIFHPRDDTRKFSFLLRVNRDKTAYEATVGALETAGEYPVHIVILSHQNRRIKRLDGVFHAVVEQTTERKPVSFMAPILPMITDPPPIVTQVVAPVAETVGIAAGATQLVVLLGNVPSLNNLWLIFLRLFSTIAAFFRRGKVKPWGVVYDAETKRPLDPAYVILEDMSGKTIATAVTDLDGRYGFLAKPGVYRIVANKTNYRFPSEKLMGKKRDELYEDLYFGEPFELRESDVVNYNIPMDPIGFDWNEYEKQRLGLFEVHSQTQRYVRLAANIIFALGFLFSAYTAWIVPRPINFGILAFYVLIFVIQLFWRRKHRLPRVLDAQTGEPLRFAVVKAWMPGNDVLIKRVITDEYGRLYLLVAPGEYYLTVEQRLGDGSYKLVHTTDHMPLPKGFITTDILVPHDAIETVSYGAAPSSGGTARSAKSLADLARAAARAAETSAKRHDGSGGRRESGE